MSTINKKNLFAVILAGGSGTRFWPLSRGHNPKQFLSLATRSSLLSETISRVQGFIPKDQIILVASHKHRKKVLAEAKKAGVPSMNVLWEPSGKNTAPAVCWAAQVIYQRNPQALLAVLPSDHLILKKNAFHKILMRAFELAVQDYLVTLGIVPTRPDTGYGYLNIQKAKRSQIYKVVRFVEKPDLKKAQEFLKKKTYLWNSGMFIWKAAVVLEEFKQHLPEVYKPFAWARSVSQVRKFWKTLPSISVDYGIMEKSRRVAAVPAQDIGWSDVGSWQALWEILKKGKQQNSVIRGAVLSEKTSNSLILGSKRLIATIGIDNLVIVDTEDALLICRKDQSQDIKTIVNRLKEKKLTRLV